MLTLALAALAGLILGALLAAAALHFWPVEVEHVARHADPRIAPTPADYPPRHAAGAPATLGWSADGDVALEHTPELTGVAG